MQSEKEKLLEEIEILRVMLNKLAVLDELNNSKLLLTSQKLDLLLNKYHKLITK